MAEESIWRVPYRAEQIQAAIGKGPRVNEQKGTWELWDVSKMAYYDTGVPYKGPQGEPGAQGPQGEIGPTPDIQIGNVETLPAGEPATAEISGTPENPVLNLGIPAGHDGAGGDMMKYIYDPQNKSTDVFKYADEKVAAVDKKLDGKANATTLQSLAETLSKAAFVETIFAEKVTLANVPEGSILKITEDGVHVAFLISKHNYESERNGAGRTLVIRAAHYRDSAGEIKKIAWNSSGINTYANSTVDVWLNTEYKNLFSERIRSAIGTTKFPYTPGNKNKNIEELERSVFLISLVESFSSYTPSANSNYNIEGSNLPFIPQNNGGYGFWTRTPYIYSSVTKQAYFRYSTGNTNNFVEVTEEKTIFPAFTLPASLEVYKGLDGDYYIEPQIKIQNAVDTNDNTILNVLNTGKIACGTYNGTDIKPNSETPMSLTVPFVPKFLYIRGSTYNIILQPTTPQFEVSGCVIPGFPDNNYTNAASVNIFAAIQGNTVFWYSENKGAAYSCNTGTTTYSWIAIG